MKNWLLELNTEPMKAQGPTETQSLLNRIGEFEDGHLRYDEEVDLFMDLIHTGLIDRLPEEYKQRAQEMIDGELRHNEAMELVEDLEDYN